MTRSPFHITPDDLIRDSERRLARMVKTYPAKVREGSMSSWSAQHLIAMEEARLSVFKKMKKDPQGNLFSNVKN